MIKFIFISLIIHSLGILTFFKLENKRTENEIQVRLPQKYVKIYQFETFTKNLKKKISLKKNVIKTENQFNLSLADLQIDNKQTSDLHYSKKQIINNNEGDTYLKPIAYNNFSIVYDIIKHALTYPSIFLEKKVAGTVSGTLVLDIDGNFIEKDSKFISNSNYLKVFVYQFFRNNFNNDKLKNFFNFQKNCKIYINLQFRPEIIFNSEIIVQNNFINNDKITILISKKNPLDSNLDKEKTTVTISSTAGDIYDYIVDNLTDSGRGRKFFQKEWYLNLQNDPEWEN